MVEFTSLHGLTKAAALARLKADGPNELSEAKRRSLWRIVTGILSEPLFSLLLAAAVVYFLLGDLIEAVVISLFASLSIFIAIIQEVRSERVLEKLRELTSPRALVVRDGQRQRIPGREAVRGDIVILHEGDRVPADAVIRECSDLAADESLLTGESAPVRKRLFEVARDAAVAVRPGGNDLPYIYAGTMIIRGQGVAQITSTGKHSEIGKIGQSLQTIEIEPPRLRTQTRRLVKFYATVGLLLSLFVVILYGTAHDDWYQALLGGIALGMSMLPEEFPLVLTVFMVMGAWRISRAGVLTRRAAAIETLGATTVLCTDKTGTLTVNRMTVVELRDADQKFSLQGTTSDIPERFHNLVDYAALASAEDPFDPMELAFHSLAKSVPNRLHAVELVRTYGLRKDLLALTQAWKIDGEQDLTVAVKGAPEAIAILCGLGPEESRELKQEADKMGAAGIRVLAVAHALCAPDGLPESPSQLSFTMLGLVGLADPLRPEVPVAMQSCQTAGIRVVMITGDYPATAKAIAMQAGILPGGLITGEEIVELNDIELVSRVRNTNIFARIMPEQKLRIVEALKANGEIVAMTGDGVNDAPALQAAHIGIAMGGRGTDVAREASSIVLLNDDFGSIVETIRLGRRIYNNLQKVMRYIIAVHVPIAGTALLPLIADMPMILGPIHIALLEMIIDPVCAIAFEAEDEGTDVMRHPPRDPQAALLPNAMTALSLGQGLLALAGVMGVYFLAPMLNFNEPQTHTLTFVSLVISSFFLIFTNRSLSAPLQKIFFRKNSVLPWVFSLTILIMATLLAWPFTLQLLKFDSITANGLLLSCGIASLAFILMEIVKRAFFARKARII